MNSRLKEMGYVIPLGLLLLIVVPLLMAAWIYEGPRRLIVKSFRKVRRGRI